MQRYIYLFNKKFSTKILCHAHEWNTREGTYIQMNHRYVYIVKVGIGTLASIIVDQIVRLRCWELKNHPWSSGYGRRLTIQRSWVWIPAPYTGWTWHFFTLICCKNCNNVCLRGAENKRKRGRGWPIFKKTTPTRVGSNHGFDRGSQSSWKPIPFERKQSSNL